MNALPKKLFVFGRYKKLKRGIPQTKWYCFKCKGKGCKKCDFKGQTIFNSVEERIARVLLSLFKAEKEKFHGSGREDKDVLMLGNGRPFVIELINPKTTTNLKEAEKEINSQNVGEIEVKNLRFSSKKEVIELKNSTHSKKYRALVESEKPLNKEKLRKILTLNNSVIQQFTPKRVAHRRALKTRLKKIFSISFKQLSEKEFELIIVAEHGTYIKEFISGENNRTKPSISLILNCNVKCKELDVLKILD
jgi:tRNA pseudouridine synthase 10